MVPVKTNSNWLPSIFNDFFENEWLAKTGVTAPAINVIENDKDYKVEMALATPVYLLWCECRI